MLYKEANDNIGDMAASHNMELNTARNTAQVIDLYWLSEPYKLRDPALSSANSCGRERASRVGLSLIDVRVSIRHNSKQSKSRK